MSYYRDQLENYLKKLDVKANFVIDLGGKQKPVKGRTKSWDVKDVVVLDLPEYNVDEPISYNKKCDLLFCLEVFEYLIVPTVAMKNIANMLENGGRAHVSFPFVYPLHNEVEFDSLRYTISGIKRLAEFAGLKIVDVIPRKTRTRSLVNYYNEDGMKSAKGHDHNITGHIVVFTK